MKVLENVLRSYLVESGSKINEKLNKRRCNIEIIHRIYDRHYKVKEINKSYHRLIDVQRFEYLCC